MTWQSNNIKRRGHDRLPKWNPQDGRAFWAIRLLAV